MARFVGLDVSQKLTSICVVDDTGGRLWRGQCATDPGQIARAVRRHAGGDAKIGLETGPMTPWLVHELRAQQLDITCLDARHASAALKMQMTKTDQHDAEGLAQIMRTGWYRSVHVKSLDAHRARALLGARAQLVGMTTRLSNHIRGLLKTFSLSTDASKRCLASEMTWRRSCSPCWWPGGGCASRLPLSTKRGGRWRSGIRPVAC